MWLRELARTGAQTVADLHALLDGDDVTRRARSAYVLGKVGDRRWTARRLLEVLARPEDHGVRRVVAFSLTWLDAPSTRRELVRLLRNDPDADVRENAAFALGFMRGGLREIQALADVLDDRAQSVDLRRQAANALGGTGSWLWFDRRLRRAAIPVLLRVLRDSDPEIRATAAFNLGNIGRKTEIPVLERLTTDNSSVRERWEMHSVAEVAERAITRIQRHRAPRR
jgi:HEAT repeat protein